MVRGKKKTWAENMRDIEWRREYYERRIAKKPLASPCMEGRLKHHFREKQTRSLTPDLTCHYCRKSVAQVRTEQRTAKMAKKIQA